MPPVGFEPTISAGEQPQTYALHRAATGTGIYYSIFDFSYTTLLRHLRYFEIYCLMIYVNFFSHVTPTCSYRFLFFFCLHMRSYGK